MKMQVSPTTVIFDLDGTIIDSEKPAFEIARAVLPKFGKNLSQKELNYLKGKPWLYVLKEMFPDDGQEIYDEILVEWDRVNPKITMYDGMHETLSALQNLGIDLGIVSSKGTEYIVKDLEDLSIRSYFETVVGQRDTYRHKPYPDPLILAAKLMDVAPSNCIYIGDQESDIIASRSAGMMSGGAIWGEGNLEMLSPSEPDYIFSTPRDVVLSLFPEYY